MTPIPPDMVEYLLTLISPPPPFEPAVFLGELDTVNFDEMKAKPDASLSGIIVRGTPTEAQSAEFLRVLKPGAHLILMAPDSQPTGHTGACRIEDAGFEIRDSILWINEPGGFHYVPKASRSEREAGCEKLPTRKGFEAVEREEGSAGVNNPRAGAGRTADEVHNFHPTAKPIRIMEALLGNVPVTPGLPVVDPFHGSGATGIACLRTGHDFLGIDMEPDYVRIATARIQHAKEQVRGDRYSTIKIESDAVMPETVQPVLDLFGDD